MLVRRRFINEDACCETAWNAQSESNTESFDQVIPIGFTNDIDNYFDQLYHPELSPDKPKQPMPPFFEKALRYLDSCNQKDKTRISTYLLDLSFKAMRRDTTVACIAISLLKLLFFRRFFFLSKGKSGKRSGYTNLAFSSSNAAVSASSKVGWGRMARRRWSGVWPPAMAWESWEIMSDALAHIS